MVRRMCAFDVLAAGRAVAQQSAISSQNSQAALTRRPRSADGVAMPIFSF